jgi:hypothetical protein
MILYKEATRVQTTHRMPIASTIQYSMMEDVCRKYYWHSMMEDINKDINKDIHCKYYWHSMMEDIKPVTCWKVKVHHYKI